MPLRPLFRMLVLSSSLIALPAAAAWAQDAPPADPAVDVKIEKPVVTLLEAGAEPRRELRCQTTDGAEQIVEMRQKVSSTTSMNGMVMPMPAMPTIVMTMRAAVLEITPDDHIRFETKITDAKAEGNMSNPMLQPFVQGVKQAIGTTTTSVFTRRGEVVKTEMDQAEGLPGVGETFATMTVQWPEEAVGVGAKWKSVGKITTNGLSIEQTAEFELVKMEGDRIELKLSMMQTAKEQALNMPGMPPDAKATVKKLEGKGEGSMVVDLAFAMPLKATMKTSQKMDMEMLAQGMAMDMSQTTNVEVEVTGRNAKDAAAGN